MTLGDDGDVPPVTIRSGPRYGTLDVDVSVKSWNLLVKSYELQSTDRERQALQK